MRNSTNGTPRTSSTMHDPASGRYIHACPFVYRVPGKITHSIPSDGFPRSFFRQQGKYKRREELF